VVERCCAGKQGLRRHLAKSSKRAAHNPSSRCRRRLPRLAFCVDGCYTLPCALPHKWSHHELDRYSIDRSSSSI